MDKPHIYVVDDSFETQKVLVATFVSLGCRVSASVSAEDAYEKIVSQTPPDLIILDFLLPGESGPQFLRRLFHHPQLRSIQVVPFTSTLARHENAAESVLSDYSVGIGKARRSENIAIVSKGENDRITSTPPDLIIAVGAGLRRAGVSLPDVFRKGHRQALEQLQ